MTRHPEVNCWCIRRPKLEGSTRSSDRITRCAAQRETWRKDQCSRTLRCNSWFMRQYEAPIAADLKRSMREKAKLGELTFALSADVSEAHRQVPIHPDDWHLLECQVISGGEVFINTVGTFGIASASYYWSRVAGAVGRLAQYLIGNAATTWHMLVADDYPLECGGAAYRRGLSTFFVPCAVIGVPLSWHKTSGGDVLVWVGFELLLRSRSVGISARRAEWFVRRRSRIRTR